MSNSIDISDWRNQVWNYICEVDKQGTRIQKSCLQERFRPSFKRYLIGLFHITAWKKGFDFASLHFRGFEDNNWNQTCLENTCPRGPRNYRAHCKLLSILLEYVQFNTTLKGLKISSGNGNNYQKSQNSNDYWGNLWNFDLITVL